VLVIKAGFSFSPGTADTQTNIRPTVIVYVNNITGTGAGGNPFPCYIFKLHISLIDIQPGTRLIGSEKYQAIHPC
jgi:hypothetical protein